MILATAALLLSPPALTENPGQMFIVGKDRRTIMPLERTSVNAEVAGMGARVTVKQTFVNPSANPIEAIYTFPLPADAAVDRMKIRIGDRTIDGSIMRRAKAKEAYEQAKAAGQTAALLDQETDNVFTQSVANIAPGRRIVVEISYVQLVKFDQGRFEFVYPMVVGPRFLGKGTKNPEKVSPPTLPPGVRSGANIDLTLTLHGGAPIVDAQSVLHQVRTNRVDPETIQVTLAQKDEIPNRDFILRYRTASTEVKESLFTTWNVTTGGHFALLLAPPPKPDETLRSPKEMIFVIDQSGSQSGFPIEKSKELSLALLATMGPRDSFNVMGFSNEVDPLWPGPRPNTPENMSEAKAFIKGLQANGGTELEKAIVASLSAPTDPERVRVVLFNTDGLAGQESVILKNVRRFRGNSRLFTFGIGNGVNRGLIDAMSQEGRGASEVVTLAEDAEAAKDRFEKRLNTPLLVNVQAKFEGGTVTDVTPGQLPDVFSAAPVVVYGRFTKPGKTSLTLTGTSGGRAWRRTIEVDLPQKAGDGSSVASLWARAKIAELKSAEYASKSFGEQIDNAEVITKCALDYKIMSEYTSFVAIDRSDSNGSKVSTTIRVPVEMPDGMSFGMASMAAPASVAGNKVRRRITMGKAGAPGNYAGGFGGGGGGLGGGRSGGEGISVQPEISGYDPVEGKFVTTSKNDRRLVLIPKNLLDAKGSVMIRVSVSEVSEARLEQLRKAGFKVESHDGSTLVFGSSSAATIREIAKLAFVQRIDWLHAPQ